MEASDEGQPSPFARPTIKSGSPTSFQPTFSSALKLTPQLMTGLVRAENAFAHQETQQQSTIDHPVINSDTMVSALHSASEVVGYVPESASYPSISQGEHIIHGDINYTSSGPPLAPYGVSPAPQTHSAIAMPTMPSNRIPQMQATPQALYSSGFQLGNGPFNPHQYPNANLPGNPCNFPTAAQENQIISPFYVDPARASQGNVLVGQFASKIPPWIGPNPLGTHAIAHAAYEIEGMGTTSPLVKDAPMSHNNIPSPDVVTCLHPRGNHATQPHVPNIATAVWNPTRGHVGQAESDIDHMQTLQYGGNSVQRQSQSIDVDNEANNLCGGVNRPLPQDTIDLSSDPTKPSKLKKMWRKKENVSHQEVPSYRIPHRLDSSGPQLRNHTTIPNQLGKNNGGSKTRFEDPLCQPRRQPIDPPVRPFSSPVPANSPPPMLSGRGTNSKSTRRDIEPTGFGRQEQPSDGDVDVPLGGLGRETRELGTETNGSRNRNRSDNKRRRPNSGTEKEGPARGYDDPCTSEKRRNMATRPKRRTKQDARNKKPKKKVSTKPLTQASRREEAANEDSDEISALILDKKMPAIGSYRIPARSHGDSPQSNTVADASHSDDDNFGVAGNEISSDDDEVAPVNISPRQRRTRSTKMSEAIAISDSPRIARTLTKTPRSPKTRQTSRKPRTPKTTASRGIASKSKYVEDDPHGERLIDSSQDYADKVMSQSPKKKPRGRKTAKVPKTPSSPVNLVSPTPSGPERKSIRRSPRIIKRRAVSKQKAKDPDPDSSDDDFDVPMSAQTRGKTTRRSTANDVVTRSGLKKSRPSTQRGAESEGRSSRVEKRDTDLDSIDEEPKSLEDSSYDEDSDGTTEFPSQEQGSQPIDLNVKIVRKKKKAGPKVFLEREFRKLSPDELAIIRVAFIKRYPSPPSNMQAQGRYEAAHGTEMTSGMVQRTWETQLKPWSERWWNFYLDFNNKVRERKAAKPRSKDPTLREHEVKTWVEEYYREHGDAKPAITDIATKSLSETQNAR